MRSPNARLALLFLLAVCAAPAAEDKATPVFQGATWTIVGGDNQTVAPGVPFALIAQLSGPGPLDGVEVGLLRVLSGGPSLECDTGVTNTGGAMVVTCIPGFWPFETQIRITLADEFDRVLPDFNVTILPPIVAEGLRILGSERITAARGQDFDLTVQAARFGQPLENLRLEVTRNPIDVPLSCPTLLFTDSFGEARATCRSLDSLSVNAVVLVTITDGQGDSVTFTVTLLAQDKLTDGIFKLSGDDQAVAQGTTFPLPLVAQSIIDGRPAGGVELDIKISDPNLVFCPKEVVTNSNGIAFIQCSSGFIQGNGFAAIGLSDDFGGALLEPFRVSVINEDLNNSANFQLISKPKIIVFAGNTIEDAVIIETRRADGSPVGGVPVFFTSNQNIIFEPPVALSTISGRASTTATFGCPGGNGIISVGPRPGAANIRVRVEVRTGGPAQLVRLQGDGQTGAPGERLDKIAVVAQLTDRCLNPITRKLVSWRVLPVGAATLENVISTTDGNGKTSVIVRLGQQPGPFQVIAKYVDLETTFNLAVVAEPGGVSALGPRKVSLPRGQTVPLGVRVISPEGFPIPQQTIFFDLVDGAGELSPRAVLTDSNGEASTQYTAPDSFGTANVLATLPAGAALVQEGEGGGPVPQIPLEVVFDIAIGGRRPAINADGFVNGASFRPGWTPGSLATIFGQGLMEDITRVVTPSGPPFPTESRGVSVTINGVPAPIITLADQGVLEQINLQTPFEIQPGPATVVVSNNGTEQTFEGVPVNRAQPGLFELNLPQGRFAAALHSDFRLVQSEDPARPGEIILLFLTGLGPTNPPVGTNQAGPAPAPAVVFEPTVGLNHQGVLSFGGFYAPGLATVYQINFRVPDDIETGNHELTVVTDGAGSQTVLLAVRR